MRIAFCQPSSVKGAFSGPERQTVQVGKALQARGHQVLIGVILVSPEETAQDTTLGRMAQDAGLDVYPLYLPQKYKLFASAKRFRQFAQIYQPDVVCVAGYKADIVAAIARCTPSVAVTRGWTAQDVKVRLFEWLDRRLLRWHSAVITVSHQQRQEVLALNVPAEKVFTILNGIDLHTLPAGYEQSVIRHELHLADSVPIAGVVGRLSVEKGQRYALQALRDVPDVQLLVVGDGRERETLGALAIQIGLEDRVHFLGERIDARQIIGTLDVLVLPSLTEGIPNVILEAFAYKTPMVATAVGGVPELVKDGETGWLVPPRDPHALAQAIREAVSNPEEARRRAENAYRHLLANFTVEKQVERWEQALHAAVENWRSKGRRGIRDD